jgi:hypothetical protein
MPINPNRRINKYISKVDPEVIKDHFTNLKSSMVEQVSNVFPALYNIEVATKTILDQAGTPMAQYPFYLAFARQVWKKIYKTRLGGQALHTEIDIIKNAWRTRGLDPTIINNILRDVFGILPPPVGGGSQ